jgi:hypothetical protein
LTLAVAEKLAAALGLELLSTTELRPPTGDQHGILAEVDQAIGDH